MICPSCGHHNLNENAPFCGGCGKPLVVSSESSESSGLSHAIGTGKQPATKSRKWIGGITAAFVCLAIAVAVVISVRHFRGGTPGMSTPKSSMSGSAGLSSSTSPPSTPAPSAPDSSTSGSSTASSPGGGLPAAGSSPSQVANLLSLAMGGNVDKVSSEANVTGFLATELLDDLPNDDGEAGWAAQAHFPQEIVLSFFGHQPALISSVQIRPADVSYHDSRAKDVEIWTSNESEDAGFSQVARKTFAEDGGEETLSFTPVQARYVKIRVLSNYGSDQFVALGRVKVTEASGNGYTPLLQRNPDLAALVGGALIETVFKPGPVNSAVVKATPDTVGACQPNMAALPRAQNASRKVLVIGVNYLLEAGRTGWDEVRGWFDHGGAALIWHEPRWATPARLLNAEGFDTVVLSEVCDIKTSVSDEFKRALVAWVMQGHKLIIRDSDGCVPGPDYTFLPYRFVTNNVACGCEGHHLTFVEENSIGNAQPKDPGFLDLDKFASAPNELGDSNVIVDWDANWCGHMITTNAKDVTGFVEAYAHLGRGLIIYDGFDRDNHSINEYRRLVMQELEQPFDPDGLSCSSKVGHFVVTTDLKLHDQPVSSGKAYAYPLTVFANQAYKGELKMSVSSNPPDPTLSFHFDADNIALKDISKTRLTVATTAQTPAIPRALEVRATDTKGESNALCLEWTEVAAGPTEESIKAELDKTGRAILYINFDFNKASIRPDGRPIIAQVVKLLVDNPDMQLAINGHTDNVGAHDYNVQLSGARAAAVLKALEKAGISASRLDSGGFGPDQPIADNNTEKGRAKNRRVELVKK